MNQRNHTNPKFIEELLDFLSKSVTPFHAVQQLSSILEQAGFIQLHEGQDWDIQAKQRYFVTRNDSSIIALQTGQNQQQGMHIIGAHTDSPCLKIKPQPDIVSDDYWQLGVEVYGGALLHPWFDRDLSIAGRISGITGSGQRFDELIDFERAIACVPSLAIHLNREANKSSTINEQKHLPLLLTTQPLKDAKEFHQLLLQQSQQKPTATILDFELCCYDTQPAAVIGLYNEFIASARLDNLLSSFIGVKALINSDINQAACFVSNDHEEVGSASACGAQGPFLRSTLERICTEGYTLNRLIQDSLLYSVDNAHALHPNYKDRHDAQHSPILNQGPVLKVNANQRYASNSITSANFRHLCRQNDIPIQTFVTRSDLGCGSTIGPITASELGIATVDIGVPQLAMHSIRELAGTQDCIHMLKALTAFLNR